METNLPTPMTARVYVNLPEGKYDYCNWGIKYPLAVKNMATWEIPERYKRAESLSEEFMMDSNVNPTMFVRPPQL